MKKEAIYIELKYPGMVFFYKGENGDNDIDRKYELVHAPIIHKARQFFVTLLAYLDDRNNK